MNETPSIERAQFTVLVGAGVSIDTSPHASWVALLRRFELFRIDSRHCAGIQIGSISVTYENWRIHSLMDARRERIAADVRAALRINPAHDLVYRTMIDKRPAEHDMIIGPSRSIEPAAPPTGAQILAALRRFTSRRREPGGTRIGSAAWLREMFQLLNQLPAVDEPRWRGAVDRVASAFAGLVLGLSRHARRASSMALLLAAGHRVLHAPAARTSRSAHLAPLRSSVTPTAPPAIAA